MSSAARFAAQNLLSRLVIVLWTSVLGAQTCLVLSPVSIRPDGATSLDLALYTVAGTRPSAVQWTFQYPSASVKRLAVEEGAALTSVEKTAICAGDATTYKCLTVGAAGAIDDGIIAKVTAVLAPGNTMTAIVIKNALGTSPTGNLIPIASKVRLPGSGGPSTCAQSKASK
jgi:hypothetical protein